MSYFNFIPILYFYLWALALSLLTKVKAGRSLILVIMANMLVLYVFSLLGQLRIGLYGLIFALIVLIFVSIIRIIQTKERVFEYDRVMFTVFYFGLSYFIVWLNQERYLFQYDDFAHWGLMIKETLRLNDLYSVSQSHLVSHKDYPPIIILFEYLWLKLARSFREPYIFQSLQFLGLMLIFPVLNFSKKTINILSNVLFIVLWVFFQSLFSLEDGHFYTTIYLDAILGLLFARSLFLVWKNNHEILNYFDLSVTLTILILTKEMGFVLVGLVLIYNILIHLFISRHKLHYFIPYISPAVFFISWKVYLIIEKVSGQFNTQNLSFLALSHIFLTGGTITQLTILQAYWNALMNMPIINETLSISYIGLVVFSLILFTLCSVYFKKRHVILNTLFLSALSLLYSAIMLIFYLFLFSEREAIQLASFQRYTSTFWYSIGAFYLFYWFSIESKQKTAFRLLFTFGLIILILFSLPEEHKTWLKQDLEYDEDVYFYQQDMDIIMNNTEENDTIYLVAQGQNPYWLDKFRYWLNTRILNSSGHSLGKPYGNDDYYTINFTSQEFTKELMGYEYLYIYWTDDQFNTRYGNLFEDPSRLRNHQLYKVIKTDTLLQFIAID